MRRLARHVFNTVAVLSLLLCVATVSLWVRTYFLSDELLRFTSQPRDPSATWAPPNRATACHLRRFHVAPGPEDTRRFVGILAVTAPP